MNASVEKFLAKHLGVRAQKDLPADVAETLENISIDINTVVLKAKDTTMAIKALPKVQHGWKVEESDWDILLELQGQQIPMTFKRNITQVGNNWVVSDVSNGMMGELKDKVVYDNNFKTLSRESEQARQKMTHSYEGSKASVNTKGKDMAMECEGMMVCDGPGFDILLGNMAMKKGDKMTYHVVDMQTMKAKKVTAEHMGGTQYIEKPHQKISVTSTEDENDVTTTYIFNDKIEAVKIDIVIPAMGNAI